MQQSLEPLPTPIFEPPAREAAGTEDTDELTCFERIVASVGAWFGGLLVRCAPPSGPFFASDGRQAAHGESFRAPPAP
jgi:hypothetical protein